MENTGNTVIYNNDYISEIERHRDIWKKRFETENMLDNKIRYEKQYKELEKKLEAAICFQDTLDSVKYVDIPKITVIKTMGGHEIPAKYVQLI